MVRRSLTAAVILGIVLLGSVRPAAADDDKATAKELFLAGKKAFEARDYRAAAASFEEAYRKKPHHDALYNAAHSWLKAGENVRAANLYAKYLREAKAGTPDRDVATAELGALSQKLGKVVLHSTGPDDLKVDDTPNDPDGVFVQPGEHVVSGKSGSVVVKKSVNLVAGQTLSFTLDPPPPPKTEEPVKPPPPKPAGFHLPWVVVAIGGALALGGGGVTIWSGLDANKKRDRFDERNKTFEATQGELDDGRSAQFRTNIFLAATAGVTLLTGVAAIFVDWGGSKSGGVFIHPSIGHLTVGYRH